MQLLQQRPRVRHLQGCESAGRNLGREIWVRKGNQRKTGFNVQVSALVSVTIFFLAQLRGTPKIILSASPYSACHIKHAFGGEPGARAGLCMHLWAVRFGRVWLYKDGLSPRVAAPASIVTTPAPMLSACALVRKRSKQLPQAEINSRYCATLRQAPFSRRRFAPGRDELSRRAWPGHAADGFKARASNGPKESFAGA